MTKIFIDYIIYNMKSNNLEYNQILVEVASKYSINLTETMLNQFSMYCNFLLEYNEKVNLTAITDRKEIYQKHFADSIVGVEFIKNDAVVCDIGTGAGFPGVVLKMVRPDIKLVLVDSLQKRIDFLTKLVDVLKLKDVTLLHNRAEDVDFKQNLNSYDVVVARAVARLNTLSEYCLPYVKVGGKFIAYKSEKTEEEVVQAKNAIQILGGKINKVKSIELFDNANRTLVIINKTKPTSNKYPRNQNKPRKTPL